MKIYTIIFFACVFFWGTTSAAYNDDAERRQREEQKRIRREQALQEKAENSSVRKKAQRLYEENNDLKDEVKTLTQQLEQKNELILELRQQIENLTLEIELLNAPRNKDDVIIDDVTVHSIPFFDIYLGETSRSAGKRIEGESESLLLHDKDRPGKTFKINPTRDNLDTLCVRVYQERIYEIIASYKDTSTKNFESIKKQLLKTFRPLEEEPMELDTEGKCMFTTLIDGILVDIVIDRSIESGMPRTLTLHYIHRRIIEGRGPK